MLRKSIYLITAIVMLLSLAVTGAASAAGGPPATGVILSTDAGASSFVLYENVDTARTYTVDAETVITDAGGATLEFADLATGQRAQVTYVAVDSILLAKTVMVNTMWPERINYSGYVVALDDVAKALSVRNRSGELTFRVGGGTRYWGVASFDELEVGQYVALQALWRNGYWLAYSVAVIRAPRVELQGSVIAIDTPASRFTLRTTLGELTVLVDAETVFKKNMELVAFGDLQVGDRVRARMIWLPEDTWLAKVVNILPVRPTVFEGRVTEKQAEWFTVATVQPGSTETAPVTFLINEATVYMQCAVPVTYDQVVVGAYVRVQALQQPDDSWLATKVVIVKPPRVEFRGVVTALAADSFTIETAAGDVTFVVDDATNFLDCGVPATFGDLAIGDSVRVLAWWVPGESSTMVWLAKQVCILPPPVVEYIGVVTTKGPDTFTVQTASGDVAFLVDGDTLFTKGLEEVDFGTLAVGDRVRVRAVEVAEGTWLAKKVRILPAQITVRGVVTEKLVDEFTVSSTGILYSFGVNEATLYVKQGTTDPTYADVAVGDPVVATAVQQTDGSWLAVKVKIITGPGPTP